MTNKKSQGSPQPSRLGNEPAKPANQPDRGDHREDRDNRGNRILESD